MSRQGTVIKEAVATITGQKESNEDKLKAHSVLSSRLKTVCTTAPVPEDIFNNRKLLLDTVLKSIRTRSPLTQCSLQMLGYLLFNELLARSLDQETVDKLMLVILEVIKSENTNKALCTRALWCLSSQNIDCKLLKTHIKDILNAVQCLKTSQLIETASVASEVIGLLHKLYLQCKEEFVASLDIWYKLSLMILFTKHIRVQQKALAVLIDLEEIVKSNNRAVSWLHNELKNNLMSQMHDAQPVDPITRLRIWCYFVRVLGKNLHKSGSFLNDMLKVVENGFKHKSSLVQVEAYISWRTLINDFSLDASIITNYKRIKLLLMPLLSCAAKQRCLEVDQARVVTWWHLITSLLLHVTKETRNKHLHEVASPFLLFCLGIDPKKISLIREDSTPKELYDHLSSTAFHKQPYPLNSSFLSTGCLAILLLLGINNVGGDLEDTALIPSVLLKEEFSSVSFSVNIQQIFMIFLEGLHETVATEKCDISSGVIETVTYHILLMVLSSSINSPDPSSFLLSSVLTKLSSCKMDNDRKMELFCIISKLSSSLLLAATQIIQSDNLIWKNLLEQGLSLVLHNKEEKNLLNFCNKMFFLATNTLQQGSNQITTQDRFLRYHQLILFLINACQENGSKDNSVIHGHLWCDISEQLLDFFKETGQISTGNNEMDFGLFRQTLQIPFQYDFSCFKANVITVWKKLYYVIRINIGLHHKDPNLPAKMISEDILTAFQSKISDFTALTVDSLVVDIDNYLMLVGSSLLPIIDSINLTTTICNSIQLSFDNVSAILKCLLEEFNKLFGTKVPCDETGQERIGKSTSLLILVDTLIRFYTILPLSHLILSYTKDLATPLAHFIKNISTQKVLSDGSLSHKKICKIWKSICTSFNNRYSDSYSNDLLKIMSPLLEVTFLSKSREIVFESVTFWCNTFGKQTSLQYPDDLRIALTVFRDTWKSYSHQISLPNFEPLPLTKPHPFGWFDKIDQFIQDTQPNILLPVTSCTPLRYNNRSPSPCPHTSVTTLTPSLTTTPTSVLATPISSRTKRSLEDDNSQDYVVITPTSKKRRLLTEHQKDKRTQRNNDIPVLYNAVEPSMDTQDGFNDELTNDITVTSGYNTESSNSAISSMETTTTSCSRAITTTSNTTISNAMANSVRTVIATPLSFTNVIQSIATTSNCTPSSTTTTTTTTTETLSSNSDNNIDETMSSSSSMEEPSKRTRRASRSRNSDKNESNDNSVTASGKRPRGRPRKHPFSTCTSTSRRRGRPKKNDSPVKVSPTLHSPITTLSNDTPTANTEANEPPMITLTLTNKLQSQLKALSQQISPSDQQQSNSPTNTSNTLATPTPGRNTGPTASSRTIRGYNIQVKGMCTRKELVDNVNKLSLLMGISTETSITPNKTLSANTSTEPVATSGSPVVCNSPSTEPVATSGPPVVCNGPSTEPVATSGPPVVCNGPSTEPVATSGPPNGPSTEPVATSGPPVVCNGPSTEPVATSGPPVVCNGPSNEPVATSGPPVVCNGPSTEPVATSGLPFVCNGSSTEPVATSGPPVVCNGSSTEPLATSGPPVVCNDNTPVVTSGPPKGPSTKPVATSGPPVVCNGQSIEPIATSGLPFVCNGPSTEPVATSGPPVVCNGSSIEPIATNKPPVVSNGPSIEPVATNKPPAIATKEVVSEPVVCNGTPNDSVEDMSTDPVNETAIANSNETTTENMITESAASVNEVEQKTFNVPKLMNLASRVVNCKTPPLPVLSIPPPSTPTHHSDNQSPICATPVGILKTVSQFDTPLSVMKGRHVQFANPVIMGEQDPPISHQETNTTKHSKNKRKSPFSSRRTLQLNNSSGNNTKVSNEPPSTPPSSSSDLVFPSLVDCDSPVEQILSSLSPSGKYIHGLYNVVHARNITTIGNLSSLSEQEVNTLPIRSPKVTVLRTALRNFENTLSHAINKKKILSKDNNNNGRPQKRPALCLSSFTDTENGQSDESILSKYPRLADEEPLLSLSTPDSQLIQETFPFDNNEHMKETLEKTEESKSKEVNNEMSQDILQPESNEGRRNDDETNDKVNDESQDIPLEIDSNDNITEQNEECISKNTVLKSSEGTNAEDMIIDEPINNDKSSQDTTLPEEDMITDKPVSNESQDIPQTLPFDANQMDTESLSFNIVSRDHCYASSTLPEPLVFNSVPPNDSKAVAEPETDLKSVPESPVDLNTVSDPLQSIPEPVPDLLHSLPEPKAVPNPLHSLPEPVPDPLHSLPEPVPDPLHTLPEPVPDPLHTLPEPVPDPLHTLPEPVPDPLHTLPESPTAVQELQMLSVPKPLSLTDASCQNLIPSELQILKQVNTSVENMIVSQDLFPVIDEDTDMKGDTSNEKMEDGDKDGIKEEEEKANKVSDNNEDSHDILATENTMHHLKEVIPFSSSLNNNLASDSNKLINLSPLQLAEQLRNIKPTHLSQEHQELCKACHEFIGKFLDIPYNSAS